jgi:hypothetical protein
VSGSCEHGNDALSSIKMRKISSMGYVVLDSEEDPDSRNQIGYTRVSIILTIHICGCFTRT